MDLRGWGVRGVALGAVVAVLAACSNDPEPDVTPTPTLSAPVVESPEPSPSPTSSPSPTALTEEEVLAAIPEAARTEDFWGAQEFTRYFLENYQEMMQTTPEEFDVLTSPDCGFCSNVKEVYAAVEARGNLLEGGRIVATHELAQGGLQDDGTWGVRFPIDVDEMVERGPDGKVVETFEGGPGVAEVLLIFDAHWKVLELSAEESP